MSHEQINSKGYLPCDLYLMKRFGYYGTVQSLLLAGFGTWLFRISS